MRSLDDVGSLLSCLLGLAPKVYHILASVCEQLLPKPLKVSIYQRQRSCKVITHHSECSFQKSHCRKCCSTLVTVVPLDEDGRQWRAGLALSCQHVGAGNGVQLANNSKAAVYSGQGSCREIVEDSERQFWLCLLRNVALSHNVHLERYLHRLPEQWAKSSWLIARNICHHLSSSFTQVWKSLSRAVNLQHKYATSGSTPSQSVGHMASFGQGCATTCVLFAACLAALHDLSDNGTLASNFRQLICKILERPICHARGAAECHAGQHSL